MKIIRARNVNDALPAGLDYLLVSGVREETRAGTALVSPVPVVTLYSNPLERVLFSDVRDANPFFHMVESLWMLLGRGDAALLNRFISNFGERFAEEDGMIHGAYGRRWRNHFVVIENPADKDEMYPKQDYIDQLQLVIVELRQNPFSRQVVLTMWDPEVDLARPGLKDRPCNTHVYFRVRSPGGAIPVDRSDLSLDMTVCCRSNDAIMGAYGANAVHFAFLQEYVAAMVGVGVGFYYQMSNNFHLYQRDLDMLQERADDVGSHHSLSRELYSNGYTTLSPERLVDNPVLFNRELVEMIQRYENVEQLQVLSSQVTHNRFLADTAWPMLMAHRAYKKDDMAGSQFWGSQIKAADWGRASREWLTRRFRNRETKRAQG